MEMPQMSTSWGIKKEILASLYDGILFGNKKELSVDTSHGMNEPWKY